MERNQICQRRNGFNGASGVPDRYLRNTLIIYTLFIN